VARRPGEHRDACEDVFVGATFPVMRLQDLDDQVEANAWLDVARDRLRELNDELVAAGWHREARTGRHWWSRTLHRRTPHGRSIPERQSERRDRLNLGQALWVPRSTSKVSERATERQHAAAALGCEWADVVRGSPGVEMARLLSTAGRRRSATCGLTLVNVAPPRELHTSPVATWS
jgi:hypothetical protein